MLESENLLSACRTDLVMSDLTPEDIADKYFICATTELREQLIKGLTVLREAYVETIQSNTLHRNLCFRILLWVRNL